ncbi:hypothetical protein ONZ45_g15157 [Pleurotus djamor]|nr:hypothetical protein ONZ45_g15157 [Pleurotus djamor]
MALLSLPDEILLDIFEYLPSEDLLNINSTCKAFNAVCLSDTLWRFASAGLTLDLPLGKDIYDLQAPELQRLHSKAARLAKFWTGDTFSITHAFGLPDYDSVHHVQFLSSQLLLTAHLTEEDGERKTILCIWSLANLNTVLALQIVSDPLIPRRIAAVWQKYGEELMLTGLTTQRSENLSLKFTR